MTEFDPADASEVFEPEPNPVGQANPWESTAPVHDFFEEIQYQIAALNPTGSTWITISVGGHWFPRNICRVKG
ncbi:MAG: hypothetical protein OXL33_06850 [Chloroflexota bacterium]|nr:hypothetical protein [Chloroflexota bacterium]